MENLERQDVEDVELKMVLKYVELKMVLKYVELKMVLKYEFKRFFGKWKT